MRAIRILGAIAAIAIVAVVAVGLAMYFRLIPIPGPFLALLSGAKPAEYSARYYPADTMAYGWVTLAPGHGQLSDMQDMWERFNEFRDFRRLIDEWQDDIAEETGIDFESDVMPWIGPEIGAAVIEADMSSWDDTTVAVTAGVRDREAAAAFLVKWREYMTEDLDADFAAGSHRGYNTWVDESAYQAYALTDEWLVLATDEKTLHDILNRIDGDEGGSLADDENFKAAQAALPERRFSSMYLDYDQALEEVRSFMLEPDDLLGGPGLTGSVAFASFADQAPAWVAGSTAWVERGIVAEMVSPATAGFGMEVGDLQNPAELLPHDTLGFMAGTFDPEVDRWREALADYKLADLLPSEFLPELLAEINYAIADALLEGELTLNDTATLAEALDLGLDAVEEITGIDLEADLFDHLAGEAIFVVRQFDFEGFEEDPAGNAIDAVMMLSYREEGEDALSNTMSKVAALVEEQGGLAANRVDVGAESSAVIFDLGILGMMMGAEIGYRPGYVLHDQYLTVGTTVEALSTIVARQKGEGESLASDAEYRRAVDHLAGERQFLGYVDLHGIIGQFDEGDFDMTAGEFEILDSSPGVIAISSYSPEGSDLDRATVVLTLFPEQQSR